jgi:AhpD family alkylhydroperoxidase
MVDLQRAVDDAGLEPLLLELVKMRASQINGCAYCLDMHSKDARALGESEQRLHLLAAWREASCYEARERAALAWCEDLTLISKQGAPDAINGCNRLAISMRTPVGSYVSPTTKQEREPCLLHDVKPRSSGRGRSHAEPGR